MADSSEHAVSASTPQRASTPIDVEAPPAEIPAKSEILTDLITKFCDNLQPWQDDNVLLASFQEDFEQWTLEDFRTARRSALIKLRRILRIRGVWVESDSKKRLLPESLMDVLGQEDDDIFTWTDEEIEKLLQQGDTIISSKINNWLRKRQAAAQPTQVKRPNSPSPSTPPSLADEPAVKKEGSTIEQPVEVQQPPQIRESVREHLPVQQPSQVREGTQEYLPAQQPPQVAVREYLPGPPQQPVQGALISPARRGRSELPIYNPPPSSDHGRELTNLAKNYTDEMKYGGDSDSLSLKLRIFYDNCGRVSLPESAMTQALPIMLKGIVLKYYYSTLLDRHDLGFQQRCNEILQHFEGPNYQRTALAEWNLHTLARFKALHPEEPSSRCFQLLYAKLSELQYGLPPSFQTEEFMAHKLVLACRECPECRIACSDPPQELSALVSRFKSTIIAYEQSSKTSANETFMTDRRFQSNNRRPSTRRFTSRGGNQRRRKRCFVCDKENCWSTNHSETEQNQSKDRFKNRFSSQFNGRTDRPAFEKQFKQYVVEYEGTEEDATREVFQTITFEDDISPKEEDSDDDDPDAFETYFGTISVGSAQELTAKLGDDALLHAMSMEASEPDKQGPYADAEVMNTRPARYTAERFYGLMLDTGAAERSTVGYGQFLAYNSTLHSPVELDASTKGRASIQFGIGITPSIGSVWVESPLGSAEFHIVQADVPFLLSLADMDRLQIYFNNLTNSVHTPHGNFKVIRRFGHPFFLWDSSLQHFLASSPCYLTEVEIKRLHRRFGHPSVRRLQRLLERAGHEVDTKFLEHLTEYCHYCQKHGSSPGRFRFTLHDDVEFNYSIYVDILYIDGQPVLHVVDESTRFQAGRWLNNVSAKYTWEKLQECWINTYLGPPDFIVHDQGKNFMAKEFRQLAALNGVSTKAVPVEAHNSIGIVERYHGPLRRAYNIIIQEMPDLGKDAALQMAFKAINDTAGPEGLVPTLLVFGAYPRMTDDDAPAATVSKRAATLKKAMDEVRKLRDQRKINDALNQRNGPNTSHLKDLPLQSDVLVWREVPGTQNHKWTGPHKLIGISNQDCVVEVGRRQVTFRSTSVKPYKQDSELDKLDAPQEDDLQQDHDNHPEPSRPQLDVPQHTEGVLTGQIQPPPDDTEDTIIVQVPPKRGRGRPRRQVSVDVFVASAHADFPRPAREIKTRAEQHNTQPAGQFEYSRQKEINGLIEREVFQLIHRADVPPGARVFNSRFVDEVKNKGTDKAFEKSRLVVQAYNDAGKGLVLTQSPTIQRVSQRILICLAAVFPEYGLHLRDITQAYTQATSTLIREFFVRPPPGVPQWDGFLLKVIKPLYGIPEAGNHWFSTYHKHHVDKLKMEQSTYDPCLLSANDASYFGVVGLQTDDTLILASDSFAQAEEDQLSRAKFMAKPREQLTTAHPIKFNGGKLTLCQDGAILLTQEAYHKTLKTVTSAPADLVSSRGVVRKAVSIKDQYVAQRARGAYLATVSQPEASFDLSFAAQMINPQDDDVKLLNKRIQWQIDNPSRGLHFVHLDRSSLKLVVFTDSSFANNKDFSSQIGYVIVLVDKDHRANVLHWSSTKCKRVTRSVLASELYAMSNGFDVAASIKATIERILSTTLPLTICTDSKSVYDCIVKLGTTSEKRLMVDLLCLRQAYERREINEITWIDGDTNPADAMTKSKACAALRELIDTNRAVIKATEWVERGVM